ncbi:MAG: preprotein translocase subunit SecA [Firmicutes bacterium]|nr:preprotein translocase subunit SecA [Bacillota bacterium]
MGFLEKVFGSYSDKEVKKLRATVDKIEKLEPAMAALSDEELQAKTPYFKELLANGKTLDDILPEAFAAVREGAKRALGMRHFPVQLMGGIVLHQGRISEMKTGEGKTLVATLPAYLNALEGKGVHIVTVNDYLAHRDAEWMGKVYNFMGLSVGVILNSMDSDARREAYNCDITYGTNNEYGFDYLRDNMVIRKEKMVQRELNFAIIDEVDSVLIDEARTPLIISGSGVKSTELYRVADLFVKQLKAGRYLNEDEALNPLFKEELIEEGDFVVDEKQHTSTLTQQGVARAEKFFNVENLSDAENIELLHHINNALKANYNMFRDQNYVVKNDEIIIVDEFTGRMMPGRRYSHGLHQAIEAKENVKVKRESKTLATITFQNFFNKYKKRAGMTGTAQTEESEFRNIYGMDVVVIPTNMPVQRKDLADSVYKTKRGKLQAVVRAIREAYEKKALLPDGTEVKGQPVLVGTITIEKSEELSKLLKKEGIPHNVLNAKYHEKEAEIVAEAGKAGMVTIATNMAGRGTDIKLGGDPDNYSPEEYEKLREGVVALGGLKIIGTERHEARRIDNQLRGRSGRQGDPGESQFFIAMDDDLMRLFGSDKTLKVIEAMGIEEDEPIEHSMLTKAIESAQKKIEGNNFGARKHLLEYDQVMNEQRELIYGERKRVLFGENVRPAIMNMIKDIVDRAVDAVAGESENSAEWDMNPLSEQMNLFVPMGNVRAFVPENVSKEELKDILIAKLVEAYEAKEAEIGEPERMREIERAVMLRVIDTKWMDHIDDMDQMRQGIGLHAYAQRDPLIEYKFMSYDMFDDLRRSIQEDTVRILLRIRVEIRADVERREVAKVTGTNKDDTLAKAPQKRASAKIGRNDPCPCGSGKKYKQCCGRG